MRILTSLLLAALVLTLPLTVTAAPTLQPIDIKTLALTKADLARGFEVVPDRTVSEDRPDGVAVYDVTFARDRNAEGAGPFEVRSGVARTAQVEDAVLQLESTKEAFIGEGWAETGVPALGDETLGLSQTTDGEGGKIAHYSYLFRKGSYILMVGVRGRPEATQVTDAVSLAIIVSGRLDKAIGGPAPAPAGSPAAGAPSVAGAPPARPSGSGERARVVNADGGSVNMRSEPSTSASVVTQVAEGTTLDVIGANREAEGRTWRNVRTSDNQAGWIASTLLETIAAAPPPPPPPAPAAASPAPSPAAGPAPARPEPADPPPAEGDTPPSAEATPTPSPSPSPTGEGAGASDLTFRGSGSGMAIEATMLSKNLQSGKQQVKVKVTRNGGGVQNAFVDVTARLDARRYRAIKAERTNGDGFTEVEWEMEGPPGTYELIVDVKSSENGPVEASAKSTFRWK